MTNLVEKLLLTGFGIFVLLSFFIIISPLTNLIFEYNENQDDLDKILININEIDQSIEYISIYHNESFFKEIEIYDNLNISIGEFNIRYSFTLNHNKKIITSSYKIKLNFENFELISGKKYLLSIFYDLFSIDVNFIILN
ncbi:MAG: hypothetical protein KGD57_04235 [Candidatus Lokiarchaeota archaeon]|nr:hypothetical protein [Candidatus Lokiarchaeota archaeon]